MDDAHKKPLPPERFRRLINEISEGVFDDDTPLSPKERQEAVELRTKLVELAKAYEASLEAGKTEKTPWEKRTQGSRGSEGEKGL